MTLEGSIKDAAALLQNPDDTTPLTLVRRVDSSGTQSASNIFFANNVCGSAGYFGALSPLSSVGCQPRRASISSKNRVTGGVRTALTGTNTDGYAIGVMSLENVPSAAATSYRYVKIDGVSPNFNADRHCRCQDAQRVCFRQLPLRCRNDRHVSHTRHRQSRKSLANTIVTGLTDSTKHDLVGLAYLDGTPYTAGGKASRVTRIGNNCKPLVVVN